MHRLPLALAAHPSSWRQDPPQVEGDTAAKVFARDGHACRFCGFCAPGHQEIACPDAGPPRPDLLNLVTACPLCHDCGHLGRETVEQSLVVIWLPEVSQAVLNHLVRTVHVALHVYGEPLHMAERPVGDDPPLRCAYNCYRALSDRMQHALRRIGTTSPRELGAALIGLPPAASARQAELSSGLRLLSRGRLFRDGSDIYPDLVRAWAEEGGPCHGLVVPSRAWRSTIAPSHSLEPSP